MSARLDPEEVAADVLREHGRLELPVPVEAIAKRHGAEVRRRTFDHDISGLLLREEGSAAIIGVHSRHAKTRQRFTIAHELGHLVMNHDGEVIVEHLRRATVSWRDGRSATASDIDEIAANQFAAALLMPRGAVEERFTRLHDAGITDGAIASKLALEFEVSAQAMTFRLVNLALIDPL